MIQPKRNTKLTKYANGGLIDPPLVRLRTPEEEAAALADMENYKQLRAFAKRGAGINTGDVVATPMTEEARVLDMDNYKRYRELAKRGVMPTSNFKSNVPKTEAERVRDMQNYNKLRGIPNKTTTVVKAMSGAQILGAAAPAANFIPVVGPVVSAAMAAGSALWGASDNKKAQRKGQLAADATQAGIVRGQQEIYGNQFIDDNKTSLPVYAKGGDMTTTNNPSSMGKLDAVGGDLLPISANADVVSGNTHKENKIDGSYGVTLSNNGQPIANVEDKEVIVDNDLVFSDKLKKGNTSFADIALSVNTKIGELQNKLTSAKSNAEKFSLQRTIQGLEKSNRDLFNEQEIVKNNTVGDKQETVKVTDGVVPKGAKGIKLSADAAYDDEGKEGVWSQVGKVAPMLVDNITNAIITSRTPRPTAPTVRIAPTLESVVNVNPQLAKIAKAVGSSNAAIRGNTSSSAVARAAMTSANLRGAELAGDVYAKKSDTERDMRNKQAEAFATNYNTNVQLQDQYKEDLLSDTIDRNASLSKNIGNAMGTVKSFIANKAQDKANQDLLDIDLINDPTGEKMRTYRKLGRKGLIR